MESKLWVLIPAAGESKRFKDAGYIIPKPFIPIKDLDNRIEYMIQYVIESVYHLSANIVIAPHISADLPSSLEPYHICRMQTTSGQAETIYKVLMQLPADDPVLILDCDMILLPEDIEGLIDLLQLYDVSVAVTKTFDPNASRVNQIPFPTYFVEKQPISEWGIVGARAFRNIGLLTIALRKTIADCALSHTEPYLSMAMNHYPGKKFALSISHYIDLGTPERIKQAGWEIV